jgi:hypothetical protein
MVAYPCQLIYTYAPCNENKVGSTGAEQATEANLFTGTDIFNGIIQRQSFPVCEGGQDVIIAMRDEVGNSFRARFSRFLMEPPIMEKMMATSTWPLIESSVSVRSCFVR